jgi:hypothetical protein
MIVSLLHKTVKSIALKSCPNLWNRLVVWKAERAERPFWDKRARLLQDCSDNARLTRVPNAGCVIDGFQIMHNGIKVVRGSYYGHAGEMLIRANGGCHEPQEEVVFDAIVRSLPPGSVMVELGAYWAFYSIWFCKENPSAKAYLIEPLESNLMMGRKNFEINRLSGDFTQAYVGSKTSTANDGTSVVCVDDFLDLKGLDKISILHSDIQGFEMEMLEGAKKLLSRQGADYVFVSTHGMDLHYRCRDFLMHYGYQILVSVDMDQTYSFDGILVACRSGVNPPQFVHPSLKS